LFDLEKQTRVLEKIYSEVIAKRAPVQIQRLTSMEAVELCQGS
jgi:hypothetical protein